MKNAFKARKNIYIAATILIVALAALFVLKRGNTDLASKADEINTILSEEHSASYKDSLEAEKKPIDSDKFVLDEFKYIFDEQKAE